MSKDDDIDRALALLGRGADSAGWLEPGELKRVARRRQHRRRAGTCAAAGVVVALAITTAIVVPGGSSHRTTRVADGLRANDRVGSAVQLVANVAPLSAPADPAIAGTVARAEQAFALALLQQINKTGGQNNVVLSPSSLAIALSMLQTGATGKTRDEIATVLHTSGLGSEQQDAGWAALMTDLTKSAAVSLESANSLWLQQGVPLGPDFMAAMARYFHSGVWQVDFAQDLPAAVAAINSWVRAHTNGKITKLFDEDGIDASTLLVLANAVYFKANWQYAFNPARTVDNAFHLATGGVVPVPFMSADSTTAHLRTTSSPAYDAVELPYTGGRLSALIVMPKRQTLPRFIAGLTPGTFNTITQGVTDARASVQLPRFTTETSFTLNDTLAAMGMPTAFTSAADFRALSSTPMSVQTVAQRDYLRVDEQGTEAAAATGGATAGSATPPGDTITIDHPFLFTVRDTETGTILFTAQIQNPTQ
jgi:serpin B